MEGFFTTKEAAQRLGVSDARIRQMILEGVIVNAGKFGRENVIPESEIERLGKIHRNPGRPFKEDTAANNVNDNK